jgi:GNAT superfamily N-acetyltransferase
MEGMPDDIQIVPYNPARKAEVAELLNICLGEKAAGCRDEDYWTWKHERNPFGRSVMLLAECDGRLVGVRAFMRWRLLSAGEPIQAVKPVDTVTHPEYQRRGIFSRLTTGACDDARKAGIGLIFNTPNQNSAPGYLKLGWKEVGQLPMYVKWLRPVSSAWAVLRWKMGSRRVPRAEMFFRETPLSASDAFASASHLASTIQGKGFDQRLRTDRNAEFLQWRYAQHPHIPYFAEVTGDAGRPAGILFYRTNVRSGLREIMINDLLAHDGDSDTQVKLIRQLCIRARADYVAAHAADDTPLLKTLCSLGFHRVPRRRIRLVARTLMDDIRPDPFVASNWSLCLGDLEGL